MSLAPIIKKLKQAIKDGDTDTIDQCQALIESYEQLLGTTAKIPTPKKRGRPPKKAVKKAVKQATKTKSKKVDLYTPEKKFEMPVYNNGTFNKNVPRVNQFVDNPKVDAHLRLKKKEKKPPRVKPKEVGTIPHVKVTCCVCQKTFPIVASLAPKKIAGDTEVPRWRCDNCCSKGRGK